MKKGGRILRPICCMRRLFLYIGFVGCWRRGICWVVLIILGDVVECRVGQVRITWRVQDISIFHPLEHHADMTHNELYYKLSLPRYPVGSIVRPRIFN